MQLFIFLYFCIIIYKNKEQVKRVFLFCCCFQSKSEYITTLFRVNVSGHTDDHEYDKEQD